MIEKGICMADGKTGAIILAAGRSAHMEELKPMLRMGQTTMIQREIDTIRQAGISPIVVVTGYQADINIVRIMVYISFPIGKWRKRPAAGPALFR